MGLMPIQTLPYIKRAVTHMENDMFLPFQERKVFYDFVEELMDLALGNPTINRLIKNQAALTKYESVDLDEAKKCAHCGEAMTGEGKYCCEGCEKAAMKKEEVEQIDELSNKTLKSYATKAAKDIVKRSSKMDFDPKRGKGIIAASKKMGVSHRDVEKATTHAVAQTQATWNSDDSAAAAHKKIKNSSLRKYTKAVSAVKEDTTQIDEVIMASKGPAKPMDDALKAKVKADMDKRRAARQAEMDSAKKEFDSASSKDLKKSYRKSAFKEENIQEAELDLKRTPEGMLDSIANLLKTKLRAGGKVSSAEKRLASRAKTELRRRRDVMHKRAMREDVDYATRLQLGFEKFGIESVNDLTAENKAEFFNFVDNYQGE